jgi:hypothetical protein
MPKLKKKELAGLTGVHEVYVTSLYDKDPDPNEEKKKNLIVPIKLSEEQYKKLAENLDENPHIKVTRDDSGKFFLEIDNDIPIEDQKDLKELYTEIRKENIAKAIGVDIETIKSVTSEKGNNLSVPLTQEQHEALKNDDISPFELKSSHDAEKNNTYELIVPDRELTAEEQQKLDEISAKIKPQGPEAQQGQAATKSNFWRNVIIAIVVLALVGALIFFCPPIAAVAIPFLLHTAIPAIAGAMHMLPSLIGSLGPMAAGAFHSAAGAVAHGVGAALGALSNKTIIASIAWCTGVTALAGLGAAAVYKTTMGPSKNDVQKQNNTSASQQQNQTQKTNGGPNAAATQHQIAQLEAQEDKLPNRIDNLKKPQV